jgi:Tol biopolymer transport system component
VPCCQWRQPGLHDNHGVAYYTNWSWPSLRRIDLLLGSSSDEGVSSAADGEAEVALSSDGKLLYWAEYGSTGCNLYSLDVTTSTPTVVSHTTWNQGYGFGVPSGPLFVGPSGRYVYYADHQFDANNLGLIFGSAYHVFAEDSGARFVATWYGILDGAGRLRSRRPRCTGWPMERLWRRCRRLVQCKR